MTTTLILNWLGQLISQLDWSMISRLLMATGLGAVIGFERERSGKVAGLRTHTLVSVGAALLTLISIRVYDIFPSVNGVAGYDYHLVANIIVGIGFIGAGTIMRREDKVVGTTTAAGIWVVAAVGIASGFGFYAEAISTTIVVYIVLKVFWLLEKYLNTEIKYGPYKSSKKTEKSESQD